MIEPLTAKQLAEALRGGVTVEDAAFDAFLPARVRDVSARFWTPLSVASLAVMWLDELDVGSVLDIGSGVGKFCVAAALVDPSPRRYYGLEQRPHLVAAATELAHTLGVSERVTFVHGTLGEAALPAANAYYLFNPFGENLAPDEEHFDAEVELSEGRYARDVAATEALLERAPAGAFVLVYNGFGGRVPASYEPIRIDYDLPNVLRLWVKTSGKLRSNRWPWRD